MIISLTPYDKYFIEYPQCGLILLSHFNIIDLAAYNVIISNLQDCDLWLVFNYCWHNKSSKPLILAALKPLQIRFLVYYWAVKPGLFYSANMAVTCYAYPFVKFIGIDIRYFMSVVLKFFHFHFLWCSSL